VLYTCTFVEKINTVLHFFTGVGIGIGYLYWDRPILLGIGCLAWYRSNPNGDCLSVFCRCISQLAHENIQSTVGMSNFSHV